MKKIALLVATIFVVSCSFAQRSVLVIPFDAKMFNNQESKQICEYSGVTYDKSIEQFRTNLDNHIYSALKDSMNVQSLLRSYTTDASTDLETVHHNAIYYQSEATVDDINKSSHKTPAPNSNIIAGEIVSYTSTENANKLMNVKFHDPQIFNDLIQNYQAKYVVYLTQFEILGDYSNPYSVADRSYQRTIKVHYVIYNSMGKFVHGSTATTSFSAKINDIDQICDQYLPIIAKQIARKLN